MSMVINLVEDHNIYLCEGGPVYNGGVQPTPITYLTQWKIVGNSEVHGQEIWSCGEYNATDGKYHILVKPQGGSIADIILDEPLRKTGNTADTLEYPTETSGKALLTIRVEESGGELSPLDTPIIELVDAPQIQEAESYTCEISQGGKAVSWSDFITDKEQLYAYGVQWDKENTSPDCIRIGNMELHKSLPVQSQMRGCLLNDNGEVVQYLSNADWQNPSLLDGSQGQVMVEIPEFYWKFSESGNTQSVMLSTVPIGGYKKVGKRFVSAYEATVDTYGGTNRLASVKSMETRYRGCNNSSANDNTYKTGLGRPRTAISLAKYRTYARNRKSGTYEWNCYDYLTHKVLFWLYAVEYATRYTQKSVSDTTTVSGYKTGGLGAGVTNANWNKWTSFNDNYPFVPCGTSDSLGNGSGQVQYVSYSGENASWVTVQVPRYRGIENPFGHIWKMVDGVKVVVEPGDTTSGESKVYVCYNPSQYNSTAGNTANYTYVGNEPRSNDWVKEVVFGEEGDIFCKSNGGVNSSSYYTDQHYTSANPSSVETRLFRFGGNANLGTSAGFVCLNSSNDLSYMNTNSGSRLTFIPSTD